ncbi:MAG: DUF2249 domain-containing protein [Aquificaceae bacterium]
MIVIIYIHNLWVNLSYMFVNLEAEKKVEVLDINVRLTESLLMPSSVGVKRIYIIHEGSGRYILGQKFGSIKAPALFYVKEAELFGFMPEGKGVLYEISLGKEDYKEGQLIDLRPMDHGRRHPLVIETFSKLEVGESFSIINDHDPLPLYFQMSMIFPKKVGWEYVEYGGSFWKIRIRRL